MQKKSFVYYSTKVDNLMIYHEADMFYMGSIEGYTKRKLMIGPIKTVRKEWGLVWVGKF